jgi:hypothetical protein
MALASSAVPNWPGCANAAAGSVNAVINNIPSMSLRIIGRLRGWSGKQLAAAAVLASITNHSQGDAKPRAISGYLFRNPERC